MKQIKISGALLLIPESQRECLLLWLLSFSVGSYEKACANFDVYPMRRRLKIVNNQ